ncbi:hypothetical protein WMF39_37400 [Sorangium sp. So ce1504]|uniref:hypothetical protein n=1 Tax=Sorangium sp. So ce1504 TaxID=3133337 RepID=UPI003F5F45C6
MRHTEINPQHPDEPAVTQYLLRIGYDEFEQRVRVVHGNGIATSYRYYEKSRRLQEISADHGDECRLMIMRSGADVDDSCGRRQGAAPR